MIRNSNCEVITSIYWCWGSVVKFHKQKKDLVQSSVHTDSSEQVHSSHFKIIDFKIYSSFFFFGFKEQPWAILVQQNWPAPPSPALSYCLCSLSKLNELYYTLPQNHRKRLHFKFRKNYFIQFRGNNNYVKQQGSFLFKKWRRIYRQKLWGKTKQSM